MPAVPKKKPSSSRKGHKHNEWERGQRALFKNTVICKSCNEQTFPHKVCKKCGKYKDKVVVQPKTKVRKVAKE